MCYSMNDDESSYKKWICKKKCKHLACLLSQIDAYTSSLVNLGKKYQNNSKKDKMPITVIIK